MSEDEEREYWATHDSTEQIANRQDVPYQSLIKVFLAERIRREREDVA